ncbi:hypothetical protein RchiOBHm_Chr5g0058321 [Rosa chinensis]|uniref:Uncharacterized protein n=1 Tax=Rosa chinensis TaxID=74649 RepID=A0A2P6QH58_ROSCH|nr:hypothetical protein RchiOBHm_Chr5g0058321 [Rosa chinensis]
MAKNSLHSNSRSPPITSSTTAILTLNNFSQGGDPTEDDEKFHKNSELVAASITRITASDGRSVEAKIADECDSLHCCDREHAGQPPCGSKYWRRVCGCVGLFGT